MSEGTWVQAKHEDIREGDVVRVTHKEGPKTTIIEGKVTAYNPDGYGRGNASWSIEDFENFYAYEFEVDKDSDEAPPTLERFVPPFEWPTKLGAIVTGSDAGDLVTAVLVRNLTQTLWWTADWGVVTEHDLRDLKDLTVVSEGATVEA